MHGKQSKSSYPFLIIAVFAVGLLLAGGLLYRWINRASVADREQQSEFLRAAMRSFQGDFVATLLEIRATFHPTPRAGTTASIDKYLSSFYSQWRREDANGPLVSTLSVATPDASGRLQFWTLDAQSGQFNERSWPHSLEAFRPRVEKIKTHHTRQVFFANVGVFPFAVDGNRPVVVVPLIESDGHSRRPGPWPGPESLAGPPPPSADFVFSEHVMAGQQPAGLKPPKPPFPHLFAGRLRGWCFLELDVGYLKHQLLPHLIERSFSGAGLANYRVAVLAGDPRQVVFGTEPHLTPSSLSPPDETIPLVPFREASARLFRAEAWGFSFHNERRGRGGASALVTIRPRPPAGTALGTVAGNRPSDGGAWVLVAKNRAGSIAALVARTRHRNLALGFGVLFLLAFSMGFLVITTHRAGELARREMEFVAGVSHEFRTPLAAIQSAGFNLASGVIRKSSRVQEYGALVQNEARRLADMIEQVMSYAGIQSGGKRYELVPTQVSGIIDQALADYGVVFRDSGWVVEKKIEKGLPPVYAEGPSIESAIKNLLANAIKYAATGKWLRVTAATARNGDRNEVQISVEDHGPGIDPADLPHIFEPFYRGRRVLASSVSGTGLGLSIAKRLIESHGGRVSVGNIKGKGAHFTLHLPALPNLEQEAV